MKTEKMLESGEASDAACLEGFPDEHDCQSQSYPLVVRGEDACLDDPWMAPADASAGKLLHLVVTMGYNNGLQQPATTDMKDQVLFKASMAGQGKSGTHLSRTRRACLLKYPSCLSGSL